MLQWFQAGTHVREAGQRVLSFPESLCVEVPLGSALEDVEVISGVLALGSHTKGLVVFECLFSVRASLVLCVLIPPCSSSKPLAHFPLPSLPPRLSLNHLCPLTQVRFSVLFYHLIVSPCLHPYLRVSKSA